MLILLGLNRLASHDSVFQSFKSSSFVVLIVFKVFKIVEAFTQLTIATVAIRLAKLPHLDSVAFERRLVWVSSDLEKPVLDTEAVYRFLWLCTADQCRVYTRLSAVEFGNVDLTSADSLILCKIVEVRRVKVEKVLVQMNSLMEKRKLGRRIVTVVKHVDAWRNSATRQIFIVSPGLEKVVRPLKQGPREIVEVMGVDRN